MEMDLLLSLIFNRDFRIFFFFWRKLCLVSLFLDHYWIIQLRYLWKNHFWNDFCLPGDLGKRHNWTQFQNLYFLTRNVLQQHQYYVLHGASINFVFWTHFPFFPRIFYLSGQFLALLTLESSSSFHLISEFLAISC